mgnify:CR=1 FL=1
MIIIKNVYRIPMSRFTTHKSILDHPQKPSILPTSVTGNFLHHLSLSLMTIQSCQKSMLFRESVKLLNCIHAKIFISLILPNDCNQHPPFTIDIIICTTCSKKLNTMNENVGMSTLFHSLGTFAPHSASGQLNGWHAKCKPRELNSC